MGRVQGVRTPPEMTCGFLIQLVFCQTMWFIGVEVEQEKSAPPPKKNPGSAPVSVWYVRGYIHQGLGEGVPPHKMRNTNKLFTLNVSG